MGETTAISWTDATFNPWMGCTKVSEGCANCYAETLVVGRMGRDVWGPGKPRHRTKTWGDPVKWDREARAAGQRRRVFCASLADVFDAEVPSEWRADLWHLIEATPNLDWQLLTKRPHLVPQMVPAAWMAGGFPSNVWLGTSVENQRRAEERIPHLLRVPARVRFLSCEPLIGGVDLTRFLGYDARLHWVIVGGESGPGRRPFDLEWARDLRDLCLGHGIAFFFKQVDGPRAGNPGPPDVMVRQFPRGA